MTSILEDIMNVIDYKTFIRIINVIPSCIFYKDTDLKYRFSSHCWEQLLSEDIIGKTDLEIRKDKENAILAMQADENIIRSGKGCSYVIKSEIDGNVSYLELNKEPVFDENGKVIGIVGLINDVTEKTILEQKLIELNTYDSLTNVFNRKTGTDTITACLEQIDKPVAFCLLDLDEFKMLNDNYGHQIGDRVLCEFSYALKCCANDGDVVMRLGGDEFIVFLNGVESSTQIEAFVSKLHEKMDTIHIPELQEKLSVSVGAKFIPKGEKHTFDELYMIADENMYKAKKMQGVHCIIS